MKLALLLATLTACVFPTQAKPLRVFILAGQSNMEGPASIKTFDYIGDDPATAPLLKDIKETTNIADNYRLPPTCGKNEGGHREMEVRSGTKNRVAAIIPQMNRQQHL